MSEDQTQQAADAAAQAQQTQQADSAEKPAEETGTGVGVAGNTAPAADASQTATVDGLAANQVGGEQSANEPAADVKEEAAPAPEAPPAASQTSTVDTAPAAPEESKAPAVEEKGAQDNTTQQQQETAAPQVVMPTVKTLASDDLIKQINTAELGSGSEFEAAIAKLKQNGTASQRALINNIEGYIVAMRPGKVTLPKDGAIQQASLWKTIKTVLTESSAEEFRTLWNIILGYFHEHESGAFHTRYVFRFPDHWIGSPVELDSFNRIVNLLKVTANPKDRAMARKQIDLGRTMELLQNKEAHSRLVAFYS